MRYLLLLCIAFFYCCHSDNLDRSAKVASAYLGAQYKKAFEYLIEPVIKDNENAPSASKSIFTIPAFMWDTKYSFW